MSQSLICRHCMNPATCHYGQANHDFLQKMRGQTKVATLTSGRVAKQAMPEVCNFILGDATIPQNLPLPLGGALLGGSLALLRLERRSRLPGCLLSRCFDFPLSSLPDMRQLRRTVTPASEHDSI